ncbi:MAG TPA: ATP-dependent DNA helicase [Alphaproteobacteria bacterium]|nr:ATP-dependent DNA helicase [Alphaproteobacteria bacterium]
MNPQAETKPIAGKIMLPDVPALCANARQAAIMSSDGEIRIVDHETAKQIIHKKPVLVCHAPYTCRQLGAEDILGFDILELFAFVHPAKFCVPTPFGVAKALGLSPPQGFDDYPMTLMECAQALLSDLRQDIWQAKANPLAIAGVMGQQGKGWNWTPFIYSALGEEYDPRLPVISKTDLNVWKNLPEWAEEAPEPPPSHHPVTGEESRGRLKQLLGSDAEQRRQQMTYAATLSAAFAPRDNAQEPHVVLAEAGTGVGKTLGYLAPSSVWAEKNKGTVWISTYTKNLQRQVDQELDRLYPDPQLKDNKVAVRKGRENYLCLLNLEEAAAGAALSRNPKQAIALGIMVRWAAATKDGDINSGTDFPGWLSGLLGYQFTTGLADKRGECIYSACDHYHKCFVEQSVRRSKHADIVVANHALVMIQTAIATNTDELPLRYVFDEGHHLFDAADSAFAGHLTARETYDLRRWIRGAEGGNKSRLRGLKSRAEDLVSGDAEGEKELQDIIEKSRILTADGWQTRLKDGAPKGVCETFILGVYAQVMARSNGQNTPYSIETETFPLHEEIPDKISSLKDALKDLQKPMLSLANRLRKKLNDHADTLESDTRKRLDAVQSALERRAQLNIGAWIGMLETLQEGKGNPAFVDWMEIERIDGRAVDIGLYRHWVDPMVPFSTALKPQAHGVVVTSATLRDGTENEEDNWRVARERTGVEYLTEHAVQEKFLSPFDYKERTKIFVITDVRKDDLNQVAGAYQSLFEASGGGAIGLFTAISRLRAVHDKINIPLNDKNLHLYAQHMDDMDAGTLVDIFRDDTHACLLGTDAIRDGVDVPGESLRLIVFDRVPWPRPTILHKARRDAFGRKRYDDMLTRLKLKQAYGRLIRRADDKGVFVMLDSMMPSRLNGAFPEGVEIERVGLAEAVTRIKEFL